jgi:hypothetical protein
MFAGDRKDRRQEGATRRGFLKILALTGTISSLNLFGPLKKMGLGKEVAMSPEEMREKAMEVFRKPKLFM